MKELHFKVSGMKCQGCVANASEAVGAIAGLVGADFDLDTGSARVRGDVDAQEVIDALQRVGYVATLADD
jgi:copper chaperone CopZ